MIWIWREKKNCLIFFLFFFNTKHTQHAPKSGECLINILFLCHRWSFRLEGEIHTFVVVVCVLSNLVLLLLQKKIYKFHFELNHQRHFFLLLLSSLSLSEIVHALETNGYWFYSLFLLFIWIFFSVSFPIIYFSKQVTNTVKIASIVFGTYHRCRRIMWTICNANQLCVD